MESLSIKYRPTTFQDVVEQDVVVSILRDQVITKTNKSCYLFCGGAGTGKTTCARIFANALNHGKGNPIEIDAASNNGVDNVREIIEDAKFKALDAEYKIYIIDECHMLSNGAWNAMLKLIEEPPVGTIFLFCTTDPQKIPATIMSRVQRYDFKRISTEGIASRLKWICDQENDELCEFTGNDIAPDEWEGCAIHYEEDALDYIARLADGGMRDAITKMDKCLAFDNHLTLTNVIKVLGTGSTDSLASVAMAIMSKNSAGVIQLIENLHQDGVDLKQFMKQLSYFVLDVCKYLLSGSTKYTNLPNNKEAQYDKYEYTEWVELLFDLNLLNTNLKWETAVKQQIEVELICICCTE